MSEIIGLLILMAFIAAYIVISVLNKKTPIPKSCEHAYMEAQSCETCAISGGCSFKEAIDMMKETKL